MIHFLICNIYIYNSSLYITSLYIYNFLFSAIFYTARFSSKIIYQLFFLVSSFHFKKKILIFYKLFVLVVSFSIIHFYTYKKIIMMPVTHPLSQRTFAKKDNRHSRSCHANQIFSSR